MSARLRFWAFLAVTIFSSFSPMQPQSGDIAGHAENTQQKQQSAPPYAPAVSIQQPASPASADEGHKVHAYSEVRIVSTPEKDRWDKAAIVINGLLAAAGFTGIFFAVQTLRKLERQTIANEEAAKIARDSMNLVVEKERARIRVRKPSNSLEFLWSGYIPTSNDGVAPYSGEPLVIPLEIYNRGGTTARDLTMRIWVKVTSITGESLVSQEEITDIPRELHASPDPLNYAASDLPLSPETHRAIRDGGAILFISGKIEYTDVFNPLTVRVTEFDYMWRADIQWHTSEGRTGSHDYSGWVETSLEGNKVT